MPGLCDIKTPQEGEIFNMNTDSESQSKDSDLWRPGSSTSDGLRNGDVCSSSLAAKGYRSVRLTFQDKKSPTPPSAASHHYVSHALNLICATLLSVIQPEVSALLKQAYPGTALTSQSPPNWLRLSLDFIRPDLHPETPSPGPPSPGSEPPLGQSRCSSHTQSEASTAVLEELRACGLGPEGGSRTPSPTLSPMSAVTVNMVLHSPPASTAHVTVHRL